MLLGHIPFSRTLPRLLSLPTYSYSTLWLSTPEDNSYTVFYKMACCIVHNIIIVDGDKLYQESVEVAAARSAFDFWTPERMKSANPRIKWYSLLY